MNWIWIVLWRVFFWNLNGVWCWKRICGWIMRSHWLQSHFFSLVWKQAAEHENIYNEQIISNNKIWLCWFDMWVIKHLIFFSLWLFSHQVFVFWVDFAAIKLQKDLWLCSHQVISSDFAVISFKTTSQQERIFLPFMPKLRGLPNAHSNQKVPKLYSFLFGRWHFLEDLFDNFVMLRTLALTTSYPQRPLLLPQFLALDVALMWCQSHFEALLPNSFQVSFLTSFFGFHLHAFHCWFARDLGGSRLLHKVPFPLDLVLGGRNQWYFSTWVTRVWRRLVLGRSWVRRVWISCLAIIRFFRLFFIIHIFFRLSMLFCFLVFRSSGGIMETISLNFSISGPPMDLMHCIHRVPSWTLRKWAKTTLNLSIMPDDHIFSSPILHIPGYLVARSCRIFCVSTILSLGCLVDSWEKMECIQITTITKNKKTKRNQCETSNLPCGFTERMAVTHLCNLTKQLPLAAKETGSDWYECKLKAELTPTLLMYFSKEFLKASVSYSAILTLPHFFFWLLEAWSFWSLLCNLEAMKSQKLQGVYCRYNVWAKKHYPKKICDMKSWHFSQIRLTLQSCLYIAYWIKQAPFSASHFFPSSI